MMIGENEDGEEFVDEICRDRHSHTVVLICVQVDSEDKSQRNIKSISEYENDLSLVKTYEAAPEIK
jgi:hypothetical protein